MKKEEIIWNDNGWTTLCDADAEKHILGITCLVKDGKVIEIRTRHNDGEEKVLKNAIDANYALPMDLDLFKKIYEENGFDIK